MTPEGTNFQVFRNFDKQGNGTVPAVEVKRVLISIGDKLNDEEADHILEGMQNSYGNVNYEGGFYQSRITLCEIRYRMNQSDIKRVERERLVDTRGY